MIFLFSGLLLLLSADIRSLFESTFAYIATSFATSPITTILLFVSTILLLKVLQYCCKPAPPNSPPVYHSGYPLIGPFLSFTKDQLGTVRRARAATKSDVFTINPLGTFLIGAEAHKAFFESFDEELDQAPVYKFMTPILGPTALKGMF